MVRASKTSDKTTTETKPRAKAPAAKVEAAPAPAPEPVVEAAAEPADPEHLLTSVWLSFPLSSSSLLAISLQSRLILRPLVRTFLV